jgi:starch synthase
MLKAIVAHPGTQYSHHLVRQLTRLGLLDKYITSFATNDSSVLSTVFAAKLKNRILHHVPWNLVRTYPFEEARYLVASYLKTNQEDLLHQRNRRFQENVVGNDLHGARNVIGFDTSSWIIAEYCRRKGIKFFLDVSIGHSISKEAVFRTIRSRFPEWQDIALPKREALIEIEQKEYELASRIVVPSRFVRNTLIENGVDPDKISVNPFGTLIPRADQLSPKGQHERVTFLFFGSLAARKGLPVLLEAWNRLAKENADLLVAGYGSLPASIKLPANTKMLGAIPGDERNLLFKKADVLVFPSFFEGLAQVQLEAAANGVPVIATRNSGGEELVQDGYNGFIVEVGNVDQLESTMRKVINNRDELGQMSRRIREHIDFFSWEAYGDRWRKILLGS